MDFQHRVGAKTGGGGVASASETNQQRRDRLAALAAETIDLAKDPYFLKNHIGTFECKLCLTLHNNEASYLAHTQGKKHQTNLVKRAAKEAAEAAIAQPGLMAANKNRIEFKKFVKIGRPGYRVTKQYDPSCEQQSLLFEIDYPEIADDVVPRHRFMAAYEQRIEPPDRNWQYLLFAAEPYETIAFKIPSREVDKSENKFWTLWNPETKEFFLQFAFRASTLATDTWGRSGPTIANPIHRDGPGPNMGLDNVNSLFKPPPPPPPAMLGIAMPMPMGGMVPPPPPPSLPHRPY